MSIDITYNDFVKAKDSIKNLSVDNFIALLSDITEGIDLEFSIIKYNENEVNKAFKTPYEALDKLRGLFPTEEDYLLIDKDNHVIVIDCHTEILEIIECLPISLEYIVNRLQCEPDIAQRHNVAVAYVTEYSMLDFLSNNLHLLPVDKIHDLVKKDILEKGLVDDAELLVNTTREDTVLVKEIATTSETIPLD